MQTLLEKIARFYYIQYTGWSAQSFSDFEGSGKQWRRLGGGPLTTRKVGRGSEEV
jgi:hypothetical protein